MMRMFGQGRENMDNGEVDFSKMLIYICFLDRSQGGCCE